MTNKIMHKIQEADAVAIGAGSGLSAAAGFTYSGERFEKNFAEYIETYGMTDMYSAGFYPFKSQEEKWAYWSRHIYYNRYDLEPSVLHRRILDIIKGKAYFVITTNVDHQFQPAGFEEEKVFAVQGDYGVFQCAKACHNRLYDNEAQVRAMVKKQENLRIPSSLVPKCPVCGGNMEVNLRCDGYFVEDTKWHESHRRYEEFIKMNREKNILFLELGVGMNTPGIIKYPFWRMTANYKNACYICINKGQARAPEDIAQKSVCLDADIMDVIEQMEGII